MAEDPVLLITGASSGIGAATARRAAEAGYRVALASRREDRLRELADELGGSERTLAVRCDVTELFDERPRNALAGDDLARAVVYALSEPEHVDVNEILIRPASQPG